MCFFLFYHICGAKFVSKCIDRLHRIECLFCFFQVAPEEEMPKDATKISVSSPLPLSFSEKNLVSFALHHSLFRRRDTAQNPHDHI